MPPTVYLGWSLFTELEIKSSKKQELMEDICKKLIKLYEKKDKNFNIGDLGDLEDKNNTFFFWAACLELENEISDMVEEECGLKFMTLSGNRDDLGFYFWKLYREYSDYGVCLPYDKIVITEEARVKATQFMQKLGFKNDVKLYML